jgi:hypothetical protein
MTKTGEKKVVAIFERLCREFAIRWWRDRVVLVGENERWNGAYDGLLLHGGSFLDIPEMA